MKIEDSHALAAIAAHRCGTHITQQQVVQLLDPVRGVTFSNITTVTRQPLAAANREREVFKVTVANVQLFNGVEVDVYAAAVKRSAARLGQDASAFESSGNHFTHTDCYSVVVNERLNTHYLYAVYNRASSVYVLDGRVVDKAAVAELCTPSVAKTLLNPRPTVRNVTHDLEHDVIVRTPRLDSIVSITAMRQTVTV